MYDEFVIDNARHIDGVKKALFSIEKALTSSFKTESVEIDIFRAELTRRALCHDFNKFSDINNFVEYTVGHHNLIMLGGYNFEHGDEGRSNAVKKAYEGIDVLDRHKKSNDHHPEYYSHLSDMSIMPIIEMICDWYGAGYYTEFKKKKVICKFVHSFSKNMNCFQFDEYQTSVCNRLRDFLVDGCDSIIRSIRDACISYSKKEYLISDGVLQSENKEIKERFHKEVHEFLSKRRLELNPIIQR